MTVDLRPLGRTGLTVSAIGLGGGPLGDGALDAPSAERLLRRSVELGVRVVDTAPSYGESEARIGQVLASLDALARDSIVVVTKGGYGVEGVADWTPEVLTHGIDQALRRLQTDRVDVFLLHSCPRSRLEAGDLLAPLERAREAGKVRAVGYSGDGDALDWAVRCDVFDVVECSVSLVDQAALRGAVQAAVARGAGVLGKRSVAGAPFRAGSRSEYADRWSAAFSDWAPGAGEGAPESAEELSVRFAAHAPGVACALVGTTRVEHLERAVVHASKGPLPRAVLEDVARRVSPHWDAWPGVI